ENILHSFAGGDDGIYPTALAIDPSGNLFGGTTEGGANKSGTVFELQPSGGGFSYSIIYQFGTLFGGPCDAECGYTLDSAGNLYGAGDGGTGEGGVVFELSPSNGSWNVTVLWSFDVQDGYDPSGWPILDAQGNLYGTTEYGGADSDGNFWQLTP
ncbi:MAG: choice-of-anchor tandem repeat GloVer-containing protein, partial [Candidatus Korobacteraceae bacterium]